MMYRRHSVVEMILMLTMCWLLLAAPCVVRAATFSEVTARADQTLQGFMRYFWRHDPSNKSVGFFFACGQIGGSGVPWNECTCDTSDNQQGRCLTCYRWWDAIGVEAIANYGIYTNSKAYDYILEAIFPSSPYNGNWNATSYCTFVDDFAWYGIAYLRAYEWLKVVHRNSHCV